jgi:putative glycerol-1-phosphate prenyltransferase
MLAILLDPDKISEKTLIEFTENSAFSAVDFLLVGGSLVTEGSMEKSLATIKANTDKPCIIFPGSSEQISSNADAILLLSLLSGRNPDLLIGKHVESAFKLKRSGLELISTGYILIDGGRTTTVSYISNTIPIPQDKPEIATATALAGTMLGCDLIYLDCGSGALYHADPELISMVRKEISAPIVVGGGIRSGAEASKVYSAGADVVVVGNKLEEQPNLLTELVSAKESFRHSSIQTR